MYVLLNTDTYFKVLYKEKEFSDKLDSIITMLELTDENFKYGSCGGDCDGHLQISNNILICFSISHTGFLRKISIYRIKSVYQKILLTQYWSNDFMEALSDIKTLMSGKDINDRGVKYES